MLSFMSKVLEVFCSFRAVAISMEISSMGLHNKGNALFFSTLIQYYNQLQITIFFLVTTQNRELIFRDFKGLKNILMLAYFGILSA